MGINNILNFETDSCLKVKARTIDSNRNMCWICLKSLAGPCIECECEYGITTGVCNHQFHFHCLSHWLERSKTCPLDDKEWEFKDSD